MVSFGTFLSGGCPGARNPGRIVLKYLNGLIKEFHKMSIAGALRSANADEFRLACPAGEDNWKSRLAFCQLLADAIDREPKDAPSNFADIIEPYLNNLLDCAISERTTLSIHACRLLGAIPKVLGKDIHQHLDRILPTLIRHCASTKAVAQKSASAAVTNIITFSTYNHRLLWHVCAAFEDKYSGPKLYAPGWLKLIIQLYHPALNPDRGDYDAIAHAITIGLEEADNNVRVSSRAVYWAYNKIDSAGAETIMSKLNSHAKTALVNDPNNPDKKTGKSTKTKKDAESDTSLAQVRQQAKERMKQKAAERDRVISAKSINNDDFAFGPLKLGDDKPSSIPSQQPFSSHTKVSTAPKTTSQPIAIHKKVSSRDGPLPSANKKASVNDHAAAASSKKTISADSLRATQITRPASAAGVESSSARPLLSAPVRRPRIVATPINAPQPNSRPASRTGGLQSSLSSAEIPLRPAVSHKDLIGIPNGHGHGHGHNITSEPQRNISKTSQRVQRPEASSPILIPQGKENIGVYRTPKQNDRTSPVKFSKIVNRHDGPVPLPKEVPTEHEGLTGAQLNNRQEMENEMQAMLPLMPIMAQLWEVQDDKKMSQMHYAYPEMNHDGDVQQARRGFQKALEYLSKDSLDSMGFRKLRKLLEAYGRNLIIDQSLYNQLFSELLPRLGTFDELLTQPAQEIQNEQHPRYIRQAVLTMVDILITAYPYEWSFQFQGPSLAALMIARCAYSVNCVYHEGATYRNNMTIVNQINNSIEALVACCINPVETLDSVIQILAPAEDFLMRHAPHDSEIQKSGSWASFNPYSKINRLLTETYGGIFHPHTPTLKQPENIDPTPLPTKLCYLMETGLHIIKSLIQKAETEEFPLGEEREDVLADLARHLMTSYNIIIRKQVMEYCQILYRCFESTDRFWTHFPNDSERNLLHYYLEKSPRYHGLE